MNDVICWRNYERPSSYGITPEQLAEYTFVETISMAQWAVVSRTGTITATGNVCAAGLPRSLGHTAIGIIFPVFEASPRYVNWLCNESFISHLRMPGPVTNLFVVSADLPGPTLATISMMARQAKEYATKIQLWERLVAVGYTGDEAFAICIQVASKDYLVSSTGNNHCPAAQNSLVGVQNYWLMHRQKLTEEQRQPARIYGRAYPVDASWGAKDNNPLFLQTFKNALNNSGTKEISLIPDPFKKVPTYSYSTFDDKMLFDNADILQAMLRSSNVNPTN